MMSTVNHTRQANASVISLLQRISDLSIIYFSILALSYINNESFSIHSNIIALLAIVIFQLIGGVSDFYRSWRGMSLFKELLGFVKNWSLSAIITVIIMLFTGGLEYFNIDDSSFLLWYFLVLIFGCLARYLIRLTINSLRSMGYNTRNVVIVGRTLPGVHLAKSLTSAPWLGLLLKGFYSSSESTITSQDNVVYDADVTFLGSIDQMIMDAKSGDIDKIYIALPMKNEKEIKKIMHELADTTCSVMLVPDLFSLEILKHRSEEVNGIPVLSLCDTPLTGLNRIIKRLEDIVLSVIILIFISPVLFSIGCAVKFTSSGPILFKQKRYGMDGKSIQVWKFRSMTVMEDGAKVTQATKNDSRFTVIGGFLRKTSLDELPQFFNTLIGDMSIVGPRPHAIAHNEEYRKIIQGYMLRHKVKPGITGWAQINGWRGETDTNEKMEKRIQYDLEYIRNWSLWLDLKIIFLTVFKGFINKSAY